MTAITLQDIGKYVLLDGKKGKDGYVLLSVKYSGGNGKLLAEVFDRKYCSSGWYDVQCVSSLQKMKSNNEIKN
jgi:hypothetical protein